MGLISRGISVHSHGKLWKPPTPLMYQKLNVYFCYKCISDLLKTLRNFFIPESRVLRIVKTGKSILCEYMLQLLFIGLIHCNVIINCLFLDLSYILLFTDRLWKSYSSSLHHVEMLALPPASILWCQIYSYLEKCAAEINIT
jgi:hypothetical protein